MKKILLTTAIVGAFTAGVFAQGTVQLVLNGSGFKAPVYGVDAAGSSGHRTGNTANGLPAGTATYPGALLVGSTFMAQMYGGPLGTAQGSLQPAAGTTTFRTGGASGFIAGVLATLSGVALDAPSATVSVRAWDNTSGLYPTWAQASVAWNNGLIAAGMSDPVEVDNVGGTLNTPPIATNLRSFNIYFVPEPSTFALAGLGAAALLIFRRRK